MINTWVNGILKPKQTFASEKANAKLGKGIINYIIAGLISGIIAWIVAMIAPGLLPGGPTAAAAIGIATVIISPIMAVIGSLIGIGIVWIFAKLFGGKGTYTSLYYLVSIVAVPFAVLNIVQYIPAVGPILGLLVGLYALYIYVLAVMSSQELTMGKAILAVVVPIIIVAIIVAILVVIAGIAILGALGGMGAETGLFGLA